MDPEARQAQGPHHMPSFPPSSKLCTSRSVRERIFTWLFPSYLDVPPSIAVLWEWRRLFIARIRCSICFSSLSSFCYPRVSAQVLQCPKAKIPSTHSGTQGFSLQWGGGYSPSLHPRSFLNRVSMESVHTVPNSHNFITFREPHDTELSWARPHP